MIPAHPYRASLLALSALAASATSANAHQGGDPADPDSCYGRCGARRAVRAQHCACDAACAAQGDCCADMTEWCAPTAVNPICALVDDSKRYSRICGTDLGFAFVHDGALEILFGDSFQYDGAAARTCSDPGLLGHNGSFNDDAQAVFTSGLSGPGWLPSSAASVRPDGSTCPSVLNFDRTSPAAPYTFAPIALLDRQGRSLSLGLSDTPLAAFSDGTTAFALFGRGPEATRRAYVARRDARVRTRYHVLEDLGTATRYHNPSAARVTSETDYTEPPSDTPGVLYLWGRPRFGSTDAQSASTNGVYLSKMTLPFFDPATDEARWSPSYFSGIDPDTGVPRWSDSESDAVPMLTSDFKVVNQLDVKWIPSLQKWLMLYGGDTLDAANPPLETDQPRHGAIHMRMADDPWGPWSRPTPLLFREHVPWYFQCDAYDTTRPRGCDRKNPTPPHYPPGDWMPEQTAFRGGACRTEHPKPALVPNGSGSLLCLGMSQRGNLYAPNMLPTWTKSGPIDPLSGRRTSTIYFVVSTWYPYDVVLAAADLTLPVHTYGNLRVSLRGERGLMLAQGEVGPTLSRVVGGAGGGPTAFHVESAEGLTGPPKIGDAVVLVNAQSGRALARRGAELAYVGERSRDATWTLESAREGSGDARVSIGRTLFRLGSPPSGSSPRAFLHADEAGVRTTASVAEASTWTFTEGCHRGDVCAAR